MKNLVEVKTVKDVEKYNAIELQKLLSNEQFVLNATDDIYDAITVKVAASLKQSTNNSTTNNLYNVIECAKFLKKEFTELTPRLRKSLRKKVLNELNTLRLNNASKEDLNAAIKKLSLLYVSNSFTKENFERLRTQSEIENVNAFFLFVARRNKK